MIRRDVPGHDVIEQCVAKSGLGLLEREQQQASERRSHFHPSVVHKAAQTELGNQNPIPVQIIRRLRNLIDHEVSLRRQADELRRAICARFRERLLSALDLVVHDVRKREEVINKEAERCIKVNQLLYRKRISDFLLQLKYQHDQSTLQETCDHHTASEEDLRRQYLDELSEKSTRIYILKKKLEDLEGQHEESLLNGCKKEDQFSDTSMDNGDIASMGHDSNRAINRQVEPPLVFSHNQESETKESVLAVSALLVGPTNSAEPIPCSPSALDRVTDTTSPVLVLQPTAATVQLIEDFAAGKPSSREQLFKASTDIGEATTTCAKDNSEKDGTNTSIGNLRKLIPSRASTQKSLPVGQTAVPDAGELKPEAGRSEDPAELDKTSLEKRDHQDLQLAELSDGRPIIIVGQVTEQFVVDYGDLLHIRIDSLRPGRFIHSRGVDAQRRGLLCPTEE